MSNKKGFVYYNVDTDRYQDIKIKRLKKDFGCNGIAVYDYILCEIYRVRGCFLTWDDSTAFDVAEYWGLKENTVTEIVNYCCNVGLFNKGLRASEGVLTSLSIQQRFIEMSGRAKRKGSEIPEKLKILPESITKPPEEPPEIPEDSDRVEKSRVEEREGNTGPPAHDLSNSNLYRKPNIPTKDQVWEIFSNQGGTKEMAKSFWDKNTATGWYVSGSPVVSVSALASKFITSWIKNENKDRAQTQSGPPLKTLQDD